MRIWSASDGRLLTVLDRLPSPAVAALFTPDGRDVIAAARDGTFVRWDAATGRRRAERRADHPAATETGSRRWRSPRRARPWPSRGKRIRSTFSTCPRVDWPPSPGRWHHMDTNGQCVAFAPDGRSLAATGQREYRHAVLYDTTSGQSQGVLEGPTTSITYTLAFAPDGRTLAVGDGQGALRIWDLATRSLSGFAPGTYGSNLVRGVRTRRPHAGDHRP